MANNNRKIEILLAYNTWWILQNPPGDFEHHRVYLQKMKIMKILHKIHAIFPMNNLVLLKYMTLIFTKPFN
jgi:hypothetical protein